MKRLRFIIQGGTMYLMLLCVFLRLTQGSDPSPSSSSVGNHGGWFGRLTLGQKQEREFMNTEDEILGRTDTETEAIAIDPLNRSSSIINTSFPPPPPPPPPPTNYTTLIENPRLDEYEQERYSQDPARATFDTQSLQENQQHGMQQQQQQQQTQGFPYQPAWGQVDNLPPPFPSYNPWDMTYGQPPIVAPNPYPGWTQQTQYDVSAWRRMDQEKIQSLESQLDGTLQHQSHLYSEIQNLTESISHLERITDLQLQQIQVLTERIEVAEQDALSESHRVLEYQINCTNLQHLITNLTCQMEQSQLACANVTQDLEKQRQDCALLEQKLHQKDVELQDFAMGVERARLQRQVEEKRKQWEEAKLKKKSHKGGGGGGLLSWIFHWFIPSSSSLDSSSMDDSEEEEARLEDLARSTLLHALQSERNNVNELETMISTLQQNNSAIADMVQSRDSLIEELNKRVGVFEDDKMVLKAALRQLQNEIKQEAPKTEQLMVDLAQARQDVRELESELESLKSLHEKEIESMNITLNQKQSLMDETDSKMNMISIYVDQLEERLASFAMARRDIEAREERCKDLEQKSGENAKEMESLERQLGLLAKERDELKDLVELLVKERTALEKKKMKLEEEIKVHTIEGESMRVQIHNLNGGLIGMKQQISDLTMKMGEMESLKNQSEMELHSLRNLRGSYDALFEQAISMESEISCLRHEKDDVLLRISDVEASKSNIEDQFAESLAEISSYKAELESLNKRIIVDVDPQSPIAVLWDQMEEISAESKPIRSTQDHLRVLNKAIIQSLALALHKTKMQFPDQDTNELVKSMCTQEFRKILSNETTTEWLKEGLMTILYSNDFYLSSFLTDQASMRGLTMLVLTKMIVGLMSDQHGTLQHFRADDHLDELPPPPPPPILEDFVEDIDFDYPDIKESDLDIPDIENRNSESAVLELQGETVPSQVYAAQSSIDGESKDFRRFATVNTENIETSSENRDKKHISESTEAAEESDEYQEDEPYSFEPELAAVGSEGIDFLDNEMDDQGVVEPNTSSIPFIRVTEDETGSSATHRRVPFRNIRKFLSRTTGLHGVITPPSTERNATTLRFKTKRP